MRRYHAAIHVCTCSKSRWSTSGPRRVQRSRARGWRMPENTVYVGRPTKWGNPHVGPSPLSMCQRYLEGLHRGELGFTAAEARRELVGRNLACWCAMDKPCHADVLLAVANVECPESNAE